MKTVTNISVEELLNFRYDKRIKQATYKIEVLESLSNKLSDLGFSMQSQLSDLENHYKIYDLLLKDFRGKYSFAIDKDSCIENSIRAIQEKYGTVLKGNDLPGAFYQMDASSLKRNWPADYVSYHCKLEGFNAKILHLFDVIASRTVVGEQIEVSHVEDVLKDLAKGVASAQLYETLLVEKEKLTGVKQEYTSYNLIEKDTVDGKQKITWNGTPNEFAVIIDALIEKGYIQPFQTKQEKIRTCLQLFDIKTQKGEPVNEQTLRSYFGNKKVPFLHNEFKLIPSKGNKD